MSATRKNILLVTGVFPPGIGGMQNYYYNICKHSSHNTTVLAPIYTNADCEAFDAGQPFRIVRKPFLKNEKINPFDVFKMFVYTRKLIAEHRIDVTIYGYILVGIIGLILNWMYGHKYVISLHGKDVLETRRFPVVNAIIRLILRRAAGILTNSEYTKKLTMELGIPAEKIKVVYPGVDDVYEPMPKDPELVAEYGLAGKYTLITVSRLVRRKGHDMVIRSMPRILEKIPNAVYMVVGDGPERRDLEALAAKLGVSRQVIFTGRVSDAELPKYFNLGDLFIMPSRLMERKGDVEGFGIVYLEAASCRKPVIGGNSGGVVEAVLNERTGLLVDPTSIDEIVQAVVRIHSDYDFGMFLGEVGYKRSKEQFRYPVIARGYDQYVAGL
ncbi:glycosyltransferase family 4 protein [Paenibacillus thermoaerophilus]|jgi:phosphatidylinositol alpha-1,6-mannosyltransferase|uniref:Glycosyltransferase family 4 protein n=1 Tax=Paenibacillus thermoaerophilus TaxID=1215385 RepID=A0ABW2V3N5_9BACL|nr:glycosyltransferase family 4 protein [Paenibacillus thermoaerophilus]TMV11033.1 glycosyltransferase family 4 protein [Paenibacillus thermoaerophilus]